MRASPPSQPVVPEEELRQRLKVPKPPCRPAQPVAQKRRLDLPAAKQRQVGLQIRRRQDTSTAAAALRRSSEGRRGARPRKGEKARGRSAATARGASRRWTRMPSKRLWEEEDDASSSSSSEDSEDEASSSEERKEEPQPKKEQAEYKALGGGWWLKRDAASDRWFYVNEASGHSQWDLPDGVSTNAPRADGVDAAAAKRVRDAARARRRARPRARARARPVALRGARARGPGARATPPAPAPARRPNRHPAPRAAVAARRRAPRSSPPAPAPVRRSSSAPEARPSPPEAPARRPSPAQDAPTAPAPAAASWLGSLEARMGRLREQLGGPAPATAAGASRGHPLRVAGYIIGPAADDARHVAARKENTPPQRPAPEVPRSRRRACASAPSSRPTRRRPLQRKRPRPREQAAQSPPPNDALCPRKSRAEFRAKIAADRRGRSPSKKDERVEVLAGPIPPLSPRRPPAVAPVPPGTTDAEEEHLVAKLRATLARRKDKAPSDDAPRRARRRSRDGRAAAPAHRRGASTPARAFFRARAEGACPRCAKDGLSECVSYVTTRSSAALSRRRRALI